MNLNHVWICFLGISACFVNSAVARESIIGGTLTNLNQLRYIVSLLELDHGHICGGAIIGGSHIVSAAHCFMYSDNTFKNNRIFALIGTIDLMKMTLPGINLEVVKIYVPMDYNASNIHTSGDIAVLKLKTPMPIAKYEHLKIVSLEKNKKDQHIGDRARFAGWGWNEIEDKNNHVTGRRTDSFLRIADADVISNDQCKLEHPFLSIRKEHLCARVEQREHEVRGVCHGDDGGALVYNRTVIGVLSKYLNNCTERRTAAIYTRVSHYLHFIRNAKEDSVTNNVRAHEIHFHDYY